ncbi:serine protease 55-like [Penaeus indicus]|uniref:serine protease 55-like n=1 Tax=Penaeus indicus TaxID=29960 RepID=UPI00300CB9D1
MNNDISLLKLSETLTFSEAVRPVCLTPNDLVFFNEKVTIIGWGKKHEKDNYGTSILNKAEVRVIPMKSCRNDYKFSPQMITSRMFCAAGKITDGCQGDSGGPLVWQDGETNSYVQIGVTSWGIGCGRQDYPGVYVKLIKFLQWIYDHTKDSVFCSSFSPTPDVEISSKGKKKKKDKKEGKTNRKSGNPFGKRRRRKKWNNWWGRRKENGGEGRVNKRRRKNGQEDSREEENEKGNRRRGGKEAKGRRGKLRRRQKNGNKIQDDNENDSKENGENSRGNFHRNRGPTLESKKRNKRKSRNGRTIHSKEPNNFNGRIRSGSFKNSLQNGKLFVG